MTLSLAACGLPPQVADKIAVVELKITPNGTTFWNGELADDRKLGQLFREAAKEPKPEIHLQPDPKTDYKYTEHVLRLAQSIGGLHLGFVGADQ